MARRIPQYIKELIDDVNHEMWNRSMKYDETNRLFFTIQDYLIHHGWYRGFNYFHDEIRTLSDGTVVTVKALHGSDQGYEYIQFM